MMFNEGGNTGQHNANYGGQYRSIGKGKFTDILMALVEAKHFANLMKTKIALVNRGDHMTVNRESFIRDKGVILEVVAPESKRSINWYKAKIK